MDEIKNYEQQEYSVEDLLAPGESILWKGKPDRVCYILKKCGMLFPVAVIWLLIDGGIIAMMGAQGFMGGMAWIIIPFFALHLAPVWIFVANLVKARYGHKNVVYAITDKRVIVRDGIVGIDFKSIDYPDINNVSVNVGMFEKFRKVGTVVIRCDGVTYSLLSVQQPYEIFKMLQDRYYNVKTDVQYPNAIRPQNNPGYNTKYEGSETDGWSKYQ